MEVLGLVVVGILLVGGIGWLAYQWGYDNGVEAVRRLIDEAAEEAKKLEIAEDDELEVKIEEIESRPKEQFSEKALEAFFGRSGKWRKPPN